MAPRSSSSQSSTKRQRMMSFSGPLVFALTAFWSLEFMGEVYPNWMDNSLCLQFIGCNAGFFGFDAMIHTVSGVAEIFAILWFSVHHPRFSIMHGGEYKSIIVILGIVALCGIGWELLELGYDTFRTFAFESGLLRASNLTQPSNIDTMGDFVHSFIGAIVTLMIILRLRPGLLRQRNRS